MRNLVNDGPEAHPALRGILANSVTAGDIVNSAG